MKLENLSMNIVNQLYDLAEVPVEKRQAINDEADAFVLRLLQQCNVLRRRKSSKVLETRYVFAWNKTYVITAEKNWRLKGSKLVLIIEGFVTDEGISTHCSPCVGDVIADTKGIHLEVVTLVDP